MRATIAQAALRRDITRVSEQRQALPDGPVIETDYRFKEVNGQDVGLLDRFGDKGALVTYSDVRARARAAVSDVHKRARRAERRRR
ncbi:DUF899 family protein [Phenylobacterium immobile]|uniref:DUF899 family protein n=1 Tax=Phenylobacterium immobile TaxID=21 RepID=UPI000A461D33|nr:DUF899 family protein [Phenylobacterium immobile]